MILVPFNDKAGYDINNLFYSSKKYVEEAKKRIDDLNARGPKGWRLIPLED